MVKNYKKYLSAIVMYVMIAFVSFADEKVGDIEVLRPVSKAYTLDMGHTSTLDTYLSSLKYEGYNLRIGYERIQAMKFNPEKWVQQLDLHALYANPKNPAKTVSMHLAMVNAKWTMMHRWKDVLPRLQLYAGGSTQLGGGALYAPANSNNVVSVKVNWSVDISAMAVYNCKVGKLPVTLRYQATMPILGAMYSLDYGESYFEMYVGNHSGLIHFSSWANRFAMENYVSADLHFSNTALRLGYRNTIESTFVNNLHTQFYHNSFVVGVSGEWMSINPRTKLSEKARVISALY